MTYDPNQPQNRQPGTTNNNQQKQGGNTGKTGNLGGGKPNLGGKTGQNPQTEDRGQGRNT